MIASPEVALLLEDEQLAKDGNQDNYIHDMTTFLTEGSYPQGLDRAKRRQLILHYIPYALVDGILFRRNLYGALLRCINLD